MVFFQPRPNIWLSWKRKQEIDTPKHILFDLNIYWMFKILVGIIGTHIATKSSILTGFDNAQTKNTYNILPEYIFHTKAEGTRKYSYSFVE
jgi:hypothetical protein